MKLKLLQKSHHWVYVRQDLEFSVLGRRRRTCIGKHMKVSRLRRQWDVFILFDFTFEFATHRIILQGTCKTHVPNA